MKKVRTVIYLEEPERKGLEALSKKTGARLTELVRRAVVDYLKRQK
jgi:ribbon-helix-helix protein